MFCSNCGKSLKPDDEKCPHCGAAVGESRFDGNPPYTATQEKLYPGKAVRSYGKHYSKDFVVDSVHGDEELPSDSDSIYRTAKTLNGTEAPEEPVLYNAYDSDDEDEPESETKKDSHFGFRFLRKDTEENNDPVEPAQDEEIGEDGLTDSERAMLSTEDTFTPIQPIGISEDVSSYMQRLKENEARKKQAQKPRTKPEELDEDAFADELNRKGKAERKAKARKQEVQAAEAEADETDEFDSPEEEPAKKPAPLRKPRIRKAAKNSEPDDEPADISPDADDEFGDFEDESKPRKKLSLGFLKGIKLPSKPAKVKEEDEPASIGDEDTEEYEDEYSEEDYLLEQKRKGRFRLIKNIAVIAAVLAIIVGAVIGVTTVREKSKTAPIETVTLSLWNDGISLMESRVKDSYRKNMLALYDKTNSTTYLTLQAAFTKDLDSISELMPEAPLQHDQVYINALKAIQESINNCLSNDALSMTDGTKTSTEKNADSALRWEAVQNILTALKNSTNVGQLEAIIKGDRVELIQSATPTPVPTATPAPYSTLANGSEGIAVTNLQTRLTELGYMSSSIDGKYGGKTKTAVEKFQQKAGLDVTGIADIATQELLFSNDAPKAK